MAGGATTAELVARVSNAGALGSLAGALLTPEAMADEVAKIKHLTKRPFAVNLFLLDQPSPSQSSLDKASARLSPFFEQLGATQKPVKKYAEDNNQQIQALLALAPPVVSFTFGVLPAEIVQQFQAKNSLVIGTATNLAEALTWQRAGADAICAQGSEAGGHRGTFIGDPEQSGIGLFALIPHLYEQIEIPVIAAGGIMSGKGIKAAMMLGAAGCQLGTAFLSCPEAGIHPAYKRALLAAKDTDTRLTRVFSGKYARGIVNEFMQRLRPDETKIPDYPVQNALTAELRKYAAGKNMTQFMSLWAGQGVAQSRTLEVSSLIKKLVDEMRSS